MKFITRAYNQFQLNSKTKASIIKSSSESRLLDEIQYYKNLPENLSIYFPRLIQSSVVDENYQMELEYYAYENLGNVMVNESESSEFWGKVFEFIFSYINTYKHSVTIPSVYEDNLLMLIDKTETEYEKLMNNFQFFEQFKHTPEFSLNGKSLKSFNRIWYKIEKYIKNLKFDSNFYFIHGDLCFSNILYGVNKITDDVILKFIDPRGSYGRTKFFGDFHYDLAKLSHSCGGGYEFFIYDKFEIVNTQNEFNLHFHNQCRKDDINQKFISALLNTDIDYVRIKLIEGLIFIGMCARHYDSLDRQKAMFMTGLSILNDIYEML